MTNKKNKKTQNLKIKFRYISFEPKYKKGEITMANAIDDGFEIKKDDENDPKFGTYEYFEASYHNFHTKMHNDLLDGKIKIYDVPFQYRDSSAYRFAHMAASAPVYNSDRSLLYKLERKLIETQLMNDILECRRQHLEWKENYLRYVYIELFDRFNYEDEGGRYNRGELYEKSGGFIPRKTEQEEPKERDGGIDGCERKIEKGVTKSAKRLSGFGRIYRMVKRKKHQ